MANVVNIILKGTDLTGPAFTSATRRLTDVGRAAASMFGVFVGGAAIGAVGSLAALGARSIQLADEMGKAAAKAGQAVEPFSQLSHAAKLADVSQQDLVTTSKKLSEEMVKQGRGSESVTEQLIAQADVFKRMEDGAEKTALAVQLFGRSGQTLIPLLNQGSDAIREQMREADRLGLTISSDFAKQADEFNDNLDKVKGSLGKLGNEVAKVVLPELVKLTETTVEWVKETDAVEKAVNFMASAFLGFKMILTDVNGLLEKFSQIGRTIQLPGMSPRGSAVNPSAVNPTNLPGVSIRPGADQPSINPNQDYGGGGTSVGAAVSPISPGSIQTLAKFSKAHEDAINKAINMERQLRVEQMTGHKQGVERLNEEYQTRSDNIANLGLAETETMALLEQAWAAHHAKLIELDKTEKERKRQNMDQYAAAASNAFGNLAAASKAFGKKGFEAWKAFSTAQAIVDTYKAANAAYAALAGIPVVGPALGAAAAAAAIAAGIANVSAIQSTKPSGQAHSGLDYVPESATYALVEGERVLSRKNNQELMSMMRGGGGGPQHIHLHVANHEIASWIYDGTRSGEIAVHPRAIREST